jgi:hypothetical protein
MYVWSFISSPRIHIQMLILGKKRRNIICCCLIVFVTGKYRFWEDGVLALCTDVTIPCSVQ